MNTTDKIESRDGNIIIIRDFYAKTDDGREKHEVISERFCKRLVEADYYREYGGYYDDKAESN